ncbi:hypothetical protein OX459_27260 [Janthinobacterium sp. SUN026]|uniref:hypothetical protein n=1 Tax=Janthinobacterium sp. SUN026 TaxID=3002438 RepID=UPI0025AFC638|nr:hypothetical protein [Janthinobacterium sp. SUN026]MDN2675105.1 hypothetical protein [Janthinobacterium sp. SUN026]
MKFWKFEMPTEQQLDALVAMGELPPPVAVAGLSNTYDDIARKLRPGDGVVLGKLKGEEGKIVVFGKVRKVGSTPNCIEIQWAKASQDVFPTGSGLTHWQTKTAFEISSQPAERYGLRRFIDFHIKDGT